MTRKRGRPKGSKTRSLPRCDVDASRCPHCESTERSAYQQTQTVNLPNTVEGDDGVRFNTVILRVTVCLNCGEPRQDKTRELRVRKKKKRRGPNRATPL